MMFTKLFGCSPTCFKFWECKAPSPCKVQGGFCTLLKDVNLVTLDWIWKVLPSFPPKLVFLLLSYTPSVPLNYIHMECTRRLRKVYKVV